MEEKKKIIKLLISKGYLVSEEFIEKLKKVENASVLLSNVESKAETNEDLLLICDDLMNSVDSRGEPVNYREFEKFRAEYEKSNVKKKYDRFIQAISPEDSSSLEAASNSFKSVGTEKDIEQDVDLRISDDSKCSKNVIRNGCRIVSSYTQKQGKKTVNDFVQYFNKRFYAIEKILRQRADLASPLSIARLNAKNDKEDVVVIGMVLEVGRTKNDNIMLSVEDPTGKINAVVSKNKPELFEFAKDIVQDEVIGIQGVGAKNIIFVNNIIQPDIPLHKELKKSPEECYGVFLSDIHVGSNLFLGDQFERFIKWLNGEVGNEEQKKVASKIKYMFIAGDLVDGCGIYPGQEDELAIPDIYKQYDECKKYLEKVPKHIQIIISPGNHDAMRLAEPQPLFYKDFSKALWELDNVSIVSNPAIVNVLGQEGFPGFDILIYHGYSFDHFISNVDSIRNNGGYDRADLIMKFLLQRRHLAPTHTSTPYIPDSNKDPLVIETIPDFFVTGHIHKTYVSSYRNVTLICGSCWQAKTSFQEKVGHNPEPARVPLVNFKTREVKILRF